MRFPFCKCLVDIVLTGRILGNKVEDTEEEYIMNKLFADIRHGDFDASELQEDSDYNHEIRMVFQEYFRDR